MFDLNEQIKIWRKNLNVSQSFETVDIEELENHLREEIERLSLSGLSEQEAFLVAGHRLGQIDSLSEEFAKVNTGILWRKRLFWSGIIVLIWIIINYAVNLVSQVILSIAVFAGTRGYALNIISNFSKAILVVLAVSALFFISRVRNINDLFYRIMNNFWGKVILFVVVFIVAASAFVLERLLNMVSVRLLSVQEIGQMSMINTITSFAWSLFTPLVLLLGIILIRPFKLHNSEI